MAKLINENSLVEGKEKALLGTIIVNKQALNMVSNILQSYFFYDKLHQIIYSAIEKLHGINAPIDIKNILQCVLQNNPKCIIDDIYLENLVKNSVDLKDIIQYANEIRNDYRLRALSKVSSMIGECIQKKDVDIKNILSFITDELTEIDQNEDRDCTQINPIIDKAYEQIKSVASRLDGISGLKSGFHSLDKVTSGWQNGNLITIGARPGMGKTAFILSMLKKMSIDAQIPTAIFSLGMSGKEIVNRLISMHAKIPLGNIRSGMLTPYYWQVMDSKLKDFVDTPLYVDDTPLLKIDDVCKKSKHLVYTKGVKLIVIDYIQLLYNENKYSDNRYGELNYFTRKLKSLARELNIPIIIVSELNRNIETRDPKDGKRPLLSDLRDSGTLCDDSDMVIFLHRPEYYKIYEDDQGNDLKGYAELIIAKHRNGSTVDIHLKYYEKLNLFMNLDDNLDESEVEDSLIDSNPDVTPF